MTIYWAPLLHLYQPPTQDIEILKIINKECYIPLFEIIDRFPVRISFNISGCLIELFHEFDLKDTLDMMKNLVSENKIEILGTAKYHPILPLIPEKEVQHQIRMNEEVNRKEFGNIWERRGFFPPEMAVSSNVAKIVHNLGYKWMILSGISCPGDWPYDKIYQSPNGLLLFFRDDIISNKISFKQISAKVFVSSLKNLFKSKPTENNHDKYLITAMDGETFGHHIKNYEKVFLGNVFESIFNDNNENANEEIKITYISDLDNNFPVSQKKIIPIESSWSTTYQDIKAGVAYPLWKHPENNIHVYYWKIVKSLNNLMYLVDHLDLSEDWEVENYHDTARYFYDKGLYSCPVWWANPLNKTWSPNLIYNGLELLLRAALNAQLALVHAGKDTGEHYFDSISYYHGLLLMELYSTTKKNLKRQ